MGYYKDRIKGSNLERQRNRFTWGVMLGSAVLGVILYFYSPGAKRLKKLNEEGFFKDDPWREDQKALWRDQFKGMAQTLSRARYDKNIKKGQDEAFPPDVLNKSDSTK